MFHHVARAVPGTVLFRDHTEARALWERLAAPGSGITALCLMPDHIHLLHPRDIRRELAARLSAYTRWRHHHRGAAGRGCLSMPVAEFVPPGKKQRRSERYVYLNPCRAGLVHDPLAWPWSTYRDALGLVAEPTVPRRAEPFEYHRYVSSDPTVRVDGTDLPGHRIDTPNLGELLDATSALLREPVTKPLSTRLKRAVAGTALSMGIPSGAIAAATGWSLRSVQRQPNAAPELVRLVARVAGDPRYAALMVTDLRLQPSWHRYRNHR